MTNNQSSYSQELLSFATDVRAGSDEARENLKALGADEVFSESQLNVKNVKSLLVSLKEEISVIRSLHQLYTFGICVCVV